MKVHFNETMLLALASILSQATLATPAQVEPATDDVQEFFEVDMSKTSGKRFVNFGVRLFSNDHEINGEYLKKMGPALTTVMWGAVWEVSAAAPAPINEGDQKLKDWIDTIYSNLRYYMDSMKNTSQLLVENDIQLINSFTNPPNAFYATPNQIERLRKNITWEEAQKTMSQDEEGDSYNVLIRERAHAFVKFWIYSLEYVKNEGFTIPFFELADEPDNKVTSVHIEPEDWIKLLRDISAGLRETGETGYGIVGPATSTPEAAYDYIKLLGEDREAYDALSKWSFRIWDDGSSLADLERRILAFGKLVKTTIPSDWERKPVVVYLGLRFDDVAFLGADHRFSGDLVTCYGKLHGSVIRDEDHLADSMAQSPVVGVRLVADVMVLLSHGVRTVVYEGLLDHNWSHSCAGLFDRRHRPKQLYAALSTLLPFVEQDMRVTRKQWKNGNECVLLSLQSSSRLIFALANLGATSCSRSFSLSGIDHNKILKVHSVAYNNGTVSLDARSPHEALVSRSDDVSYDVYEEEGAAPVVEFDVTVVSRASATVVFELGEKPVPAQEEEQGQDAAAAATDAQHGGEL